VWWTHRPENGRHSWHITPELLPASRRSVETVHVHGGTALCQVRPRHLRNPFAAAGKLDAKTRILSTST
jgi:hypothetical protein